MNKKFLTALLVSAAVLFNLAMVATTSFSGDINLAKLSQAFAEDLNENGIPDDAETGNEVDENGDGTVDDEEAEGQWLDTPKTTLVLCDIGNYNYMSLPQTTCKMEYYDANATDLPVSCTPSFPC